MFGRGGGTSLAGQCCNAAICLDLSKYMNHVIWIDPVQGLARVEPGTILDDLRNAAERYGLTFGPDPAMFPNLTAHYDRMLTRPAVQRTLKAEASVGYNLPR